ncbi:MAG: molybdopterin-dependent oxidoreductase, partial [Deltaproteobacteria bacterium]|nr:molybdopterin-dependent oxidoreductase [Deltaproteobacteria bacterium]
EADVLLVIGSNTTENHPVISTFVKRAVRRNGARLIVIDPRKIPLVNQASLWLRQRPGTDIALINGLMNVILSQGWEDKEFIASRTENFEALAQAVKKYTPEKTAEICGIAAQDLVRAARLYAKADKAMILYAMGITQHSHGTDNVKSLANLAMLCGQMGRPSTGVNPLRGQNNVQGACDLGGLPNVLTGYQPVTDSQVRAKFEQAWGATLSPDPGLVVTEMIPAAAQGKLKGLFILGENPVISDPDTAHVLEAFDRLEFVVVQDIFLTETARLADVVLPAACFAEKEGTTTNTERRVQRVRKAVDPPGQAKADWQILIELAKRMGLDWSYKNPSQIMDEIAGLTPSYGGINYRRLEKKQLQWPCPDSKHPGTPYLHKDKFARGLGLFQAIEHQEPKELPNDQYPLTLTTGRVLYQYHTRTMTGRSQGLNDLAPECEVEVSPIDAEKYGLADGQPAKLVSRRGEVTAQVWVTERVPEGLVFLPFHYAQAAANKLTNAALDPVAKIPEYKVCAVKIAA